MLPANNWTPQPYKPPHTLPFKHTNESENTLQLLLTCYYWAETYMIHFSLCIHPLTLHNLHWFYNSFQFQHSILVVRCPTQHCYKQQRSRHCSEKHTRGSPGKHEMKGLVRINWVQSVSTTAQTKETKLHLHLYSNLFSHRRILGCLPRCYKLLGKKVSWCR